MYKEVKSLKVNTLVSQQKKGRQLKKEEDQLHISITFLLHLVDGVTSYFQALLPKWHFFLDVIPGLSYPVTKSAYFSAWLLYLEFK